MKNCGVVLVTCASEEFFGKSLAPIGKKPVLQLLLERLNSANILDKVIIATTVNNIDDPVEALAQKVDVPCSRGDALDVLSRIYNAVLPYHPDGVVIFHGNAPLIDLKHLQEMIAEHYRGKYEYSYSEHVQGVILGMGASIIAFPLLERLVADKELTLQQRGIGSLYIRQHPELFKTLKKPVPYNRPQYKVYVDQPKDVELIKAIIKYVPEITNESVGTFLDENPLLAEHLKGAGISEAGVEKLFLFPEKVKSYEAHAYDNTYPISLELSLTNKCNYACEWCSDKNLRSKLGGELSVSAYKRLLDDVSSGGTKGVTVEGGGEPMLHPHFGEIIRMTAEKGFDIGLITNGSIPMDKELIDLFSWIRVSLDACTPAQYARWKHADTFERVMQNIEAIGEQKKTALLGIGYVVTKYNTDHVEDLLVRLRQYNVDYIQFRPVIDNQDFRAEGLDLSYLSKFEMPTFRVDTQAMRANAMTGNDGKVCKAHSLSTVITADGGVYLCGRLNIYDWCKPIGNINEASFCEIWHGEERKRQIKQVADPAFCRKYCPTCRMTKYNLLLDRISRIRTKNFI